MNAIFYKEWIKTRWYLLLAGVVTLGFAGYSMLRINRVVELKGVEHVWEVMLQRDAVFVDLLQYIPLLVGLLLAVVQFVPEMHRKCLNFLLMAVYLESILASELVRHILLTAVPWYLAGVSAYLLVSWVCLEPAWKRRILNLIITVLVLRVFFLSATPEAYNSFLPWLTLYTLLIAGFSWLSVIRFKEGKQD